MKFYSTRDLCKSRLYSLRDAAFLGLAPDKGLFMPEKFPQVNIRKIEELSEISFAEMASYIASLIFGDDIKEEDIRSLIKDAYDFPVPIKEVEPGKYTLQLYHGPTFAFKDFGARFMGRFMGKLKNDEKTESDKKRNDNIIVLTATSGDTGSAVAHGFWKVKGVKVIILFPEGKVSDFQQAQMTSLGVNIFPVSVKGNFDDCQRLVKNMFNDTELRDKINITSANSINILRWIPQSFYYFWGYCKWKKMTMSDEAPDIVVPSGNFGNITAAMLAWKMGMPVRRFIAGTNANDEVTRFLNGEDYSPKDSVQTVANAMDVGAPSNFERMINLFSESCEDVRKLTKGFSYSDNEIKEEISRLYNLSGYESDPHSAVGSLAYDDAGAEGFYVSTAHSAKFANVLKDSIGKDPVIPEIFETIKKKERNYISMNVSDQQLREYIFSIN